MTPQQKQARQMVEALLCLDLTTSSPDTASARTFTAREGYRTVFTGLVRDVSSVTVDGKAVTDYYPAFFENRNTTLYNSIVLKTAPQSCDSEVVVTGKWGVGASVPADLQALIDNAEAVVSKAYLVSDVKRKKTEDFDISYGDLSTDAVFVKNNAVTIGKYSMCHIGNIQHGETCGHCVRCLR